MCGQISSGVIQITVVLINFSTSMLGNFFNLLNLYQLFQKNFFQEYQSCQTIWIPISDGGPNCLQKLLSPLTGKKLKISCQSQDTSNEQYNENVF